jgi:hypothetical protein
VTATGRRRRLLRERRSERVEEGALLADHEVVLAASALSCSVASDSEIFLSSSGFEVTS